MHLLSLTLALQPYIHRNNVELHRQNLVLFLHKNGITTKYKITHLFT